MELRDYQKECVRTVDGLPEGARSVVAVATGLGKTAIAAHFKREGRVLWLSHRDELVRQPERYFAEQGASFGIEKASERSSGEDVVSASVQTLARDGRLETFRPDDFAMVICDEAHHAAAPTYRKILEYFSPKKLIGLTATPKRGDGVRLTDVFDGICFSRDLRWGIENGYLSRIRCLQVRSSFSMDKVKKQAGDYSASSLTATMKQSDDDLVVTRAYLDHCLPEGKKTLVYCPTLEVCRMVENTMKEALPEGMKNTVALLSQKNTPEERRAILERYRQGAVKCIINCMILTEGTDLPDTEAVINNRPSANDSLYQQIVGRGTRLSPGKEYCLVIDVMGKNTRQKNICTAPTLFGLDPELLSSEMKKKMQEGDLLEFADAFAEGRAKAARSIQLMVDMIDIFTQKKVSMAEAGFSGAGGAGLKEAARMYGEELSGGGRESGYDFGDLIVHETPSEARRYDVRVTFNGHAYISEPDILGKATVEISLPEMPEYDCITEPMPVEEAVRLVRDMAEYAVPSWYAQKWSKAARESMAGREPTEAQENKVRRLYRKPGLKDTGLSFLEASDLIELNSEIAALKRESAGLMAVISDTPRAAARGRRKAAKPVEDRIKEHSEAAERAAERKKKAADKALARLSAAIEAGKARREKENRMHAEAEEDGITVHLDGTWYTAAKEPSEKQKGFMESLYRGCGKMGYSFNLPAGRAFSGLDMWHAGFVITLMKELRDGPWPPRGYRRHVDLAGFKKEISRIEEPGEYSVKAKWKGTGTDSGAGRRDGRKRG